MKGPTGRPPLWSYWIVLPSFVVLWALTAWLLQSPLLPTPANVLDTMVRESASGELWHHLGATLARVVVGLGRHLARAGEPFPERLDDALGVLSWTFVEHLKSPDAVAEAMKSVPRGVRVTEVISASASSTASRILQAPG